MDEQHMTAGLAPDLPGKTAVCVAKLLLVMREGLAPVPCHSAASTFPMTASLSSSVAPALYGLGVHVWRRTLLWIVIISRIIVRSGTT